MRPGTTETTDSPTDVIPDGDLFLGVQMGGGKVAYTRNGHIVYWAPVGGTTTMTTPTTLTSTTKG